MSSDKLKPALIGGVALGFVSSIPIINCLNCACCALVLGGGYLAAFLYMKDAPPSVEPPYGDGALLGLLTGVFGAVTSTIVGIPFQLLSSQLGWNDMGQIQEAIEEAGIDLPPAAEQMIAQIGAGGMAVGAIVIGFFFNLVIYSIFAMLGAILGVATLHKKGSSL